MMILLFAVVHGTALQVHVDLAILKLAEEMIVTLQHRKIVVNQEKHFAQTMYAKMTAALLEIIAMGMELVMQLKDVHVKIATENRTIVIPELFVQKILEHVHAITDLHYVKMARFHIVI